MRYKPFLSGARRVPRVKPFLSGLGDRTTFEDFTGLDWELTREGGKPRTVNLSPTNLLGGIVGAAAVMLGGSKGDSTPKTVIEAGLGFLAGTIFVGVIRSGVKEGW